jgi:hypothetical protein
VAPGLCAGHKKRRRFTTLLAWAGFLCGVILTVAAMESDRSNLGAFWFIDCLIMFGSIVAGTVFSRIVYAKRIDKSYVRLKGCGAAFLRSLPPFRG